MRIRPLTGQVLVEVLPYADQQGGIFIPEAPRDSLQGPKPVRKGIVREVGPWPKTKGGLALLPEVRRRDKVLFTEYVGTKLSRGISQTLRLVRLKDLLAVVSE